MTGYVIDGGPLDRRAYDPATVAEVLVSAAAQAPDAGIGVVDSGTGEVRFTRYPALLDRAQRALGGLRAAGVNTGDSAVLQVPSIDGYLVALWACLLGGIRPVALTCPAADGDGAGSPYEQPGPARERLAHAWRLLDRPAVIGEGATVAGLRELSRGADVAGLRVLDLAECATGTPVTDVVAADAGDIAMYLLSSGSTGRPKAIPLTHGGLVELGAAARQQLGLDRGHTTCNWLPLDHSGALLLYHVVPVFVGATNLQAPTDWVLADPLRWLELVDRFRVDHAWAPAFGYRMVADALAAAPGRRFDLSRVRTFVSGGEQITVPVVTAFLEAAARCGVTPAAFTPCWGMTETCTAIAFGSYGDPGAVQHVRAASFDGPLEFAAAAAPDLTTFVSVGTPAPGARFRVVDGAGQPLDAGRIGRLQVRSARVTPGYVRDAEATAAALTDDGWLHTGDLAYLHDGRLTITGREKDVIILNGANHYCHAIEEVVAAVPGVRADRTAACGVPDEARGSEVLAVVFVPSDADPAGHPRTIAAIRAALASQLAMTAATVVPVPDADFPRTISGKVQRTVLRERLRRGELREPVAAYRAGSSAGPANRVALRDTVLAVLRDVAGLDVAADQPLYEQGVDSLRVPAIAEELGRRLDRQVPATALLRHPTVDALAAALGPAPSDGTGPRTPEPHRSGVAETRIAVIGMAGRFPGADDIAAFWDNLCRGETSIRRFTPAELDAAGLPADEYRQPGYVPVSGALGDGTVDTIAAFDAEAFGISTQEAALLDPQHRLFLECCHEALEHAGHAAADSATRIGVFAGSGMNLYSHHTYLRRNLAVAAGDADADPLTAMQVAIGNQPDFLATRVAYRLGLTGPAVGVQTACSTGLVAVHLATRALLAGDTDVAVAGAAAVHVPPAAGYTYVDGAMLSPTGRCRPFDADADGTVGGNGVAAVVLKRLDRALADGDTVHAVILGSAVTNDGASKVGFTAPSVSGQVAAITAALDDAGVPAETIGYVEAHGTGTKLGDPLEVQALTEAFRARERAPRTASCVLGSVKANVGHLDSCAGLAGLIKTVLVLRHGRIPPQVHHERPNPALGLADSPFTIATELREWSAGAVPRRAAVQALGVGGTNAHVVLEEPPTPPAADRPSGPHLLLLSAQSTEALLALAQRFRDRMAAQSPPYPADAFVTTAVGRRHRRHRLAAFGDSPRAWVRALDGYLAGDTGTQVVTGEVARDGAGALGFAFSGQGTAHRGIARDLHTRFAVFRDVLDRCAARYHAWYGGDLTATLLADSDEGTDDGDAQPALFAFQVALAALWRSVGVTPDYVVGHSLGEYAAWCVAGGLSIEDGLTLTAVRGRLLRDHSQPGAMLAVRADRSTVDAVCGVVADLAVAVVNGPRDHVLAGEPEAVAEAERLLTARGVAARPLPVRTAFHTSAVEAILPELRRHASQLTFTPIEVPLASTVDGELRPVGTVADPDYFCVQTRQATRYGPAVDTLVAAGCRRFLEIGPDAVLTGLGRRMPTTWWLASQRLRGGPVDAFTSSLAALHCAGVPVDWQPLVAASGGRRVPLPTYPFQRTRHWITPAPPARTPPAPSGRGTMTNDPTATLGDPGQASQVARVLTEVTAVAARQIGCAPTELSPDTSFFDIGADSLSLVGMLRELERTFQVRVAMRELFDEGITPASLSALIAGRMPPQAPPAPAGTAAPQPPPAVPPTPPPATAAPPPPTTTAPPAPGLQVPALPPVVHSGQTAGVDPAIAAAQVQLLAQFANLVAHQLQASVPAAPQAPAATPPQPAAPPAVPTPTAPSTAPAPPKPVVHGPRVDLPRASGMVGTGASASQRAHLDDLVARFVARTATSKRIAQRDRRVLADSRAIVGFRDATKEMLYPIAAREAKGARLVDVDGNSYVDITMGFGALLFGHEPDFVADAVRGHLAAGIRLGPRSEDTGVAARLLADLTGMERVAFACTGSEAVAGAVRLARAYTGRQRIVTFNGSYHGHADLVLGRTAFEDGRPVTVGVSPGVPASAVADLTVLDYDDPASLAVIETMAHEVAAVIVEPVQSRHPARQPGEFLQRLRELTRRHGIVLMFDEMLTGLRCHPRGAQGHFGVSADIATYGKALGGGFPIGAIAGSADLLDGVDGGFWQYGDDSYPPRETAFFGGTYLQHPVSMAAARAVLERLHADSPGLQQRLNARTDAFAAELNRFFADEDFPVRIVHFGSQFRFDYRGDMELLFFHLLLRGVYVWEWRNFFWSTAHRDSDVEFVVDAVKGALRDMRRDGFFGGPRSQPSAVPRPAVIPAPVPTPPATAEASPRPRTTARGKPDFSVYFFGDYPRDADPQERGKYDLIVDTTKFADKHGFHAAWLPERHFHSFGGLFPNPSVLAAALARETRRIRLHAGSVVLPLHHPVRVAEEWSVVDNLSGGRVGLCVASGWHANDFAFFPDRYGKHRELMYRQLADVRRLWRGEGLPATNGNGEQFEVRLHPEPVQPMPPLYAAVVGNPDSYRLAAQHDLGIVTNLMTQSVEQLAERIQLYRDARADAGLDPAAGRVVVLLHTYLGDDHDRAREEAFAPFCRYLRSSLGLLGQATNSLGMSIDVANTPEDDLLFLLGKAYERYCASRALIGTPESTAPVVEALIAAGINEIACFVDFGVHPDLVRRSFPALDALRRRHTGNGAATAQVVETAPLSYSQERIWLVGKMFPDHPTYNEPKAILLDGQLDVAALHTALRGLVERHAALRTVIREIDGEPRQVVLDHMGLPLPVVDRVGRAVADVVREAMAEEASRRFDLADGPLFVTRLLRLAEQRHLLILSAHHAVIDTISGYVLTRELSQRYRAHLAGTAPALPPAGLSYADYARRQRAAADAGQWDRDLAYWKERLGQDPAGLPPLALPTDRPRPAVLDPAGATYVTHLSQELSERARQFSSERRTTLFCTLLAALAGTLQRFTGQDDLVVGTAVADRPEGAEELVGVLLNTLALRLDLSGAPTFATLAHRVRDVVMDAHEHAGVPFERLLAELRPDRDPSRTPLFQVMVIYENEAVYSFDLPGVTVTLLDDAPDRALFDLTVYLANLPNGIRVHTEYNTALFSEPTVRRFVSYFSELLGAVLADPDREVREAAPLTAQDRALLAGWQGGPASPVDEVGIPALVARQAARTPDGIAVEAPTNRLTYAELVTRAGAVAQQLRRQHSAAGEVVAVCLPRCPGLVVAQLGVLSAGAAYLPVDPALPAERVRRMIADAGCRVGVATDAGMLPDSLAVCLLDETGGQRKPVEAVADALPEAGPDDLAYVVYTSGSTGAPKGVALAHRGVVNLCRWYAERTGLGPGDRTTFVSALGFDASVMELWPSLAAGATVVIPDEESRVDPQALARWLADRAVTVAWLATPMAEALSDVPAARDVPTRVVVTGGQALHRRPPAGMPFELVNTYGPTEATVIVTHATIGPDSADRAIPIGRPLPNTRLYVLDEGGRQVPVGVWGELHIGGVALARGYRHQPELTAERFVTRTVAGRDERVYRTGDIVRWNAEGELEFRGRNDDQVKIQGHRIEPEEVAHALRSLPAVRDAAVLAHREGQDRYLAAYVVPAAGTAADPAADAALRAELIAALAEVLPDRMVPRRFAFLAALPLGANGKLDRSALPRPATPGAAATARPESALEQRIHEIWRTVLGVESVGTDTSFFDLGGDSVAAARLVYTVRSTMDVEYPLLGFFQAPTIADMARRIGARTTTGTAPVPSRPGRTQGTV